jgi:CXXC-20-CXXC protein
MKVECPNCDTSFSFKEGGKTSWLASEKHLLCPSCKLSLEIVPESVIKYYSLFILVMLMISYVSDYLYEHFGLLIGLGIVIFIAIYLISKLPVFPKLTYRTAGK